MTKTKTKTKTAPTSIYKAGQSAAPFVLPWDKLNPNMRAILKGVLRLDQFSIAQMATYVGDEKLPVRNALRALVPGGYLAKVGQGLYAWQPSGLARAQEAYGAKTQPPQAETGQIQYPPDTGTSGRSPKDVAKALCPELEGADLKTAMAVVAAFKVGLSDSKIAKETDLSRGFLIPRVKRLKVSPRWSAGNALGADELRVLVAIAQGA